jgi:RNA polymerase sigma-70 factor (ECF subfamily)
MRVAWTEHRPYLVDLAFRMLGDIGSAEDVVQEAFYRLSQSDFEAIEDERGWLIVVTSRLCLDIIRSARSRSEVPVGAEDLDVKGPRSPEAMDPADRITLDDSVRLALLVLLERLSPAERIAYVLHDVFQVPFDTIAATVDRPEATCRQLARRARLKLQATDGGARFQVTESEHRKVTERFIAACANGDFDELLTVLDPQVSGGADIRPGLVVRGPQQVARNLLRYMGARTLVSLPIAGQPCLLAFDEGDIAAVLVLTMRDDRIAKIEVHAEPAKLALLRTQLRQAT